MSNSGKKITEIAAQHKVHPRTVSKIKSTPNSLYKDIAVINGRPITAQYVKMLNREERFELIEPLFQHFRSIGWQYPDDIKTVN